MHALDPEPETSAGGWIPSGADEVGGTGRCRVLAAGGAEQVEKEVPLSEEELEQQDLDRAEKADKAKADREKARADKDAEGESEDGAPPRRCRNAASVLSVAPTGPSRALLPHCPGRGSVAAAPETLLFL